MKARRRPQLLMGAQARWTHHESRSVELAPLATTEEDLLVLRMREREPQRALQQLRQRRRGLKYLY